MEESLKVGDVVVVKSGSPRMTISSEIVPNQFGININPNGFAQNNPQNIRSFICVCFMNGALYTYTIGESALKLATSIDN